MNRPRVGRSLTWEHERQTWPNAQYSRFVRAGGVDWHVQRAGSGDVVLLVHGTGASTHSWRAMFPLLAERFDVVAMDLPGHAFSSPLPIESMTMRGLSKALAGLLSVLEAEPTIVVGHSAGAAILARMLIDGRAGAQMLVSINGALLPFRGMAGQIFSPAAKLFARLGFWPDWIAHRARRTDVAGRLIAGMGSKLDASGNELYTRLARSPGHVEAALRMMAGWDLAALERDLPTLRVPLLLIVGGRDRAIAPADAARVHALVRDSAVVELADGGHLVHEELPRETAALIFDRLARAGLGERSETHDE
jgi:magnesium chelatase accessory protein